MQNSIHNLFIFDFAVKYDLYMTKIKIIIIDITLCALKPK